MKQPGTYRILARGIVQGVGYRQFAVRSAHRHGVNGWVKNLASGDVEVYASGNELQINAFIEDLHRGPVGSIIDNLYTEKLNDYKKFDSFVIRF